ncbi:hypothetical protein SPHINGO8AM_30186 [Sphingomonas sp. 8AM]|nr:hypothetical protein SPHINGO8AM_30186 [Sphingomonas sp. 8AM]
MRDVEDLLAACHEEALRDDALAGGGGGTV